VRSVELALAATACSLVLGTLAALAIARFRFPGRRAVQGFVAAPLIVPKVAIGIAAFILFLKVGLYGSFGSLVLAHTVITLPFVITLAVAGFARVDHMLEEVATDLGAVPRQMFFRATLPQMRGPMIAAAVFSFIISFDELDASIFLVGQHTNTLPTAMFIYMEKYQDPTLAALSTLLIGASLVAAVAIAFLIARVGGIRLFAQRGGAAAALEEGV
jgi:ABC-type spermidine/putrescine transport system permease subunit II